MPDFPKGKLKEGESPDFILRLSPRLNIGIELSRITSLNKPETGFIQAVLDRIRSKEEKLTIYRKKRLDSYWLLLYVPDNEYNFSGPLQRQVEQSRIISNYDRIYLLFADKKKIVQIK